MALRRPQGIRFIFRERDREQKQNRKTVRGKSGLESHHRAERGPPPFDKGGTGDQRTFDRNFNKTS